MRRRSGFTLIEMMIVLAIIAALAATLVPIAMNALNQAKVTNNLTDLESIRMAAMQYYYKENDLSVANGATGTFSPAYLKWENLSQPGLYEFTNAGEASLTITVNLNSENLANALEVQFPADSNQASGSVIGNNFVVEYIFR